MSGLKYLEVPEKHWKLFCENILLKFRLLIQISKYYCICIARALEQMITKFESKINSKSLYETYIYMINYCIMYNTQCRDSSKIVLRRGKFYGNWYYILTRSQWLGVPLEREGRARPKLSMCKKAEATLLLCMLSKNKEKNRHSKRLAQIIKCQKRKRY